MLQRLSSRILGLICVLLAFVPLTLHAETWAVSESSATLAFGTVVQDAISAPAEEDTFTFAANAGDLVLVRMSPTSGTVEPSVRIISGAGDTLCSHHAAYGSAQIAACELPTTGTYTLRAADRLGTKTGTYALYLQRLNAPGMTSAAGFGSTQSGSLTTGAMYNAYTVSGQAGDRLVMQATTTSGSVGPRIRVYGPHGDLRCQNSGTFSPVYLDTCSLLVDGSHTLLVGDDAGTNVGVYNLHVQRLNAPVGGITLQGAQLRSGTLAAAAQIDAYTFTGEVGDVLVVRAAPMSAGGLDPQVRIYDPHGTRICTRYAYDGIVDLAGCRIATQGTHTLLFDDYGGRDVGAYDLTMVRVNDPASASPIHFAQTQVGTTDRPARLHLYRFEGKTGDVVVSQMGAPERTFDPWLRIYSLDGTLICQDSAYTQYTVGAAYVHCILPADQTYVILAGSYDGISRVASGLYHLYLQRLTPAVDAVSLRFGIPTSASVTMGGRLDSYTFRAASGDVITVRMTSLKDAIYPQFRLYGTDGVHLRTAYDYNPYSDGKAEVTGITLPFSGTYTLLAGSYGATTVGPYTLSLSCDSAECGFPTLLTERVFLPLVKR